METTKKSYQNTVN